MLVVLNRVRIDFARAGETVDGGADRAFVLFALLALGCGIATQQGGGGETKELHGSTSLLLLRGILGVIEFNCLLNATKTTLYFKCRSFMMQKR